MKGNVDDFCFKNLKFLFSYLLLAVVGLSCCVDFSLIVASRAYSLLAVCKLLIETVSLVLARGL